MENQRVFNLKKTRPGFLSKRKDTVMFRLWAKVFQNNKLIRDTVICKPEEDTRTHKIFSALEEVCYQFNLEKPIWLQSSIEEFRKYAKVRFTQDHFIEAIDFDYLEIQIIEED